jgi:hypothetical protein
MKVHRKLLFGSYAENSVPSTTPSAAAIFPGKDSQLLALLDDDDFFGVSRTERRPAAG